MNRSILFYKWVLPLATAYFGYATLGSFIDSKLDTNNLVKINGIVTNYFYSTSVKSKNIKLELSNGTEYIVTSEWNNKFSTIENELKKTTNVEIYHRNPRQCLYRFGKSNIVYQLKIGDELVIGIKERQSKSRKLVYLTGFIFALGFSTILIRKRRTKNNNR